MSGDTAVKTGGAGFTTPTGPMDFGSEAGAVGFTTPTGAMVFGSEAGAAEGVPFLDGTDAEVLIKASGCVLLTILRTLTASFESPMGPIRTV